jgi:hypothetical protein
VSHIFALSAKDEPEVAALGSLSSSILAAVEPHIASIRGSDAQGASRVIGSCAGAREEAREEAREGESRGGTIPGGYRARYFPTESTPPDDADSPAGSGEGEGSGGMAEKGKGARNGRE